MEHEHISKVLEWAYELRDGQMHQYVTLYGCTGCNKKSKLKPFAGKAEIKIDHTKCGGECFRCKAKGLQLNTGDASRDISDKKWTGRLSEYREARENGIQPAGTTPEKVREAWRASEVLGKAYDANTMTNTMNITKHSAEAINHIDKLASDD